MRLLTLMSIALAASGAERLRLLPGEISLTGADARQSLVVIATDEAGIERDVTDQAVLRSLDSRIAVVDGRRIVAKANGVAGLTATLGSAQARARILVRDAAKQRTFDFARDIGGILTKRGCNSAACHGGVKGRGGLKLSANALFPRDDHEWIVRGGTYQVLTNEVKGERVPRIDLMNPEKSLLLTKPTMQAAHAGGKRFDAASSDYRTILDWIRSGAPLGNPENTEARVVALEVSPAMAALPMNGARRLLVTARFSDGRGEDYTDQVLYSSNNGDVAAVSESGIVTAKALGETAILIKGGGQAATAGVGVIGPPLRDYPSAAALNFIDEPVLRKLRQFQIAPSELSSDGEFLRRVCLDLTGTLPPPDRVREFLASRDPKKRERVIDVLVASPEFVDYWTFRFSDIFRVAIFANGLTPKWSQKYWEWIRNNIETNRPYDEVARERISAQGYGPVSRHFIPYNQIGAPADTMAEEVRVFIGRRLDCAQCHNHPYENWSQDQFWGMAAFFGRLFKMGTIVFDHPTTMDWGSKDVEGKVETVHPRTKAAVVPAVLDGAAVKYPADGNPRQALARWMTSHPYFAEAAVNRMWGYFFARGIVDPVDDFRSTNPPSHPALLTALAQDFRDHGHDLRRLVKTITMSRAYQVSHAPNASNKTDVVNYSRSPARALDAEVLLDAVVDVTGVAETFGTAVNDGSAVGQAPVGTRAINLKDPDMFFSRFLELYGRPNRGAIPERSGKPNLAQALHMLAGATYADRLSAKNSRLAKLLEAGASDARIIEEFYLAGLTRYPAREESDAIEKLIARRGDREAALREFVWALISSREFAENH